MATDDTRGRIVHAAGGVFAERGFRGATIREICRKAGANLASVNYYFGDKEHLYVEVFKAAHPGGVEPSLAKEWREEAPPQQKLRTFIHELLKRLFRADAPAWRMRLLQREILDPTPFCAEMMQQYFRTKFTQLMSALDEVLPPDMPPYRRHQLGFSIIGQCVYFRAASPVIAMIITEEEQRECHTVELLTEHISQVVLAALGLAQPLGRPAGDGHRKNLPVAETDPSTVRASE